MNRITACPTSKRLNQLISGELPEAEVEALAGHLEACPDCVETMHNLNDSTVRNDVRAAAKLTGTDGHFSDVQELMDKLIQSRGKAATVNPVASSDAQTIAPAEAPVDAGEYAFLSPPQAPDEIGRLSGYRVLRILGAGGMGLVLEAEDTRLKRRIALKVMKSEIATKGQNRQRFLREAEAAARVESDHIVPIHQVGEENGVPFIAMPFLKGEPLDARLKRGLMAIPEIIQIGRQIAVGLAAAHDQGLMHRDIKPGNVWLEEIRAPKGTVNEKQQSFRVRILDFGLARLSGDSENLTQSGMIIGTPSYMAPEQARGRDVDFRVDLWSLGCILYEMCAGQRPFNGPDTVAIITALALDNPPDPRSLNPKIPAELAQLIMKLLEKDPAKRPASAGEVAEALRKMQPEGTVVVVTAPLAEEASPWADLSNSESGTRNVESTDLKSNAESGVRNAELQTRSRSPVKWFVATALLLLIGGGFAAYQLVFKTKDGTLVVEVDGDADVRFQKGELHIHDANNQLLYTVKPSDKNKTLPAGKYLIEVAGVGGLKLDTDKFEITRDGKATVRVTVDSTAVAAGPGPKQPPKDDAKSKPQTIADQRSKGGALRFDGSTSTVAIPTLRRKTENGPLTIESWARAEKQGEASVVFTLRGTTHQWQIIQAHGNWIGQDQQLPGDGLRQRLELGKTVHLAYVADGKEGRFYVDGKRVASSKLEPFKPGKESTAHSWFGGHDGWAWFTGIIGETRVSKVARYDKDFTPAKRFETDSDTLALYHFDEGAGDVLEDSSGNKHHGKIVGAKWVKADGTAIEHAYSDRKAAEWVLSIGGSVKVNDEDKDIKAVADLPREGFRLTWVGLDMNGNAGDEGLAIFAGSKNVSVLLLRGTQVTDTGLAYFKDNKDLTAIDLRPGFRNSQFSDVGLAHFKNCRKLKDLMLGGGRQVTDKGAAYFKDCKDLINLEFAGTKITDDGLAYFKDCKNLNALLLNDTRVSNAGLENFKDCKNLRDVNLADTTVSDAGLASFKDCKNLTNVNLENTAVSGAGLAYFKDCKGLVLILNGPAITDTGLANLKGLSLRILTLRKTQVSDAELNHLTTITGLEALGLNGAKVTAAGVAELQKALPGCKIDWDKGAVEPKK